MRTELLDLPDADLLDVLPLDNPVAWLFDQVRIGDDVVVYWS